MSDTGQEPDEHYELVYLPGAPPGLKNLLHMVNETHANLSLTEYLILFRGPKHLPYNVVIPLSLIYIIIFVCGVIGNPLVCYVIGHNKVMRTSTNYYLFSLAISDMTLLMLGLPNELSVYWQQYPWVFGEVICKLRQSAAEMSSYSSVMVIVAFSYERYMAVCHPMKALQMARNSKSKALKVICGIWLISACAAAPFAYYTRVHYLEFPPDSGKVVLESAFCALFIQEENQRFPVHETSATIFFLFPICILFYFYGRIFKTLKKNEGYRLGGQREGNIHSSRMQKQRKRSIRMLGVVVLAFFICWFPFHIQRLFYVHMRHLSDFQQINEWLYYTGGILYYISATVNPIVYSIMSQKFRGAFANVKPYIWCMTKTYAFVGRQYMPVHFEGQAEPSGFKEDSGSRPSRRRSNSNRNHEQIQLKTIFTDIPEEPEPNGPYRRYNRTRSDSPISFQQSDDGTANIIVHVSANTNQDDSPVSSTAPVIIMDSPTKVIVHRCPDENGNTTNHPSKTKFNLLENKSFQFPNETEQWIPIDAITPTFDNIDFDFLKKSQKETYI